MTTPELTDAREHSQLHLEIVEDIIEVIQETFPAAAALDCHRQMCDVLTRIKNTLDHPVLFAAHIIVYLVKAVRYSRRWATLVKNIAALDPLLLKRRSSALSSPSSVLSPQHSVLSSLSPSPAHAQSTHPSHPSDPSNPTDPSNLSTPSTPCASSHSSSFILPPSSFRHSVETRLRIRAFAQALQHERRMAEKLPPSIPKPDLTPILPVHHHHSPIFNPQSAIHNPQSSILSPQHSALSPFPHSPLFPSEAFWTSKVQSLQLKILGNITRVLPNLYRAYLKQYDASISSTSSTPSTSSISSSLQSQASPPSHSSHPSYPSHSSPPLSSVLSSHSSALSPQFFLLSPQHSVLSPFFSVLSTQSSVLSSQSSALSPQHSVLSSLIPAAS